MGHQQSGVVFLTLGHMGLPLVGLVGAVTGPMAGLVALEVGGARRLAGVTSCAAAAATPDLAALLAAGVGATTVAVVTAQLQLREPLLLTEKEPTLLVVDWVRR